MGIVRSLFGVMLILSLAVHAGVVVYFESGGNSAPRPIAPERGTWSIDLQASIESETGEMPEARVADVLTPAPVPEGSRQMIRTEVVETVPDRMKPRADDVLLIVKAPAPPLEKSSATPEHHPNATVVKGTTEDRKSTRLNSSHRL